MKKVKDSLLSIFYFQAFESLGAQTPPKFLLYLWLTKVHFLNLYFYTSKKHNIVEEGGIYFKKENG